MAQAKREIERKYEGPAEGFDLPDLTRVPEVASVLDKGLVELDAVYYDTADQRLAADKITLRRRTGGTDAGWHLKLPVSLADGVRDEIQAPLEEGPQAGGPRSASRPDVRDRREPAGRQSTGGAHGTDSAQATERASHATTAQATKAPLGDPPQARDPAPDAAVGPVPPAELTGLVRSRIRDAPLLPVVRLRSARRLSHLVDDTGTLLAEVSIDHVRAQRMDGAEGAGAAAEWTEAEVELADGGAPELLDTLEKPLRAADWRPSGAPSKLARALQETAPGPVAPVRLPATHPAASAGPVLDYLRTQRDALVDLDPAVRRDLPDSVHRMRVATRRARSALRSYRNVLDRAVTDPIGAELKWLAGELGVDRDQEVLDERLGTALDDLPSRLRTGPVQKRLRSWSKKRRGGSRRRLMAVLDGTRYLSLLAALDGLLTDPPLRKAATRPPQKVLGKAVRRENGRLDALLAEALRQPRGETRDVALHEARKAAKRLRYAAEAATGVLGSDAKKKVSHAKGLQTLLGDHQDTVLARDALRDLAAEAHAAGESAFTYGVLYGREEQRAAEDEKGLGGR